MSTSIYVKRSRRDFVMVQREFLDNPKLSFRAKGIISYLMGKPDGWKLQVTDLTNHATEGRDAVYAALKELREEGYAHYQSMIPNKRVAKWEVSDERLFENLENPGPNDNGPNVPSETIPETPSGTRHPGFQDTGNQDLLEKPKSIKEANASFGGEKPRELKPLFKAISSSESVPSERSAPRRKTLAAPKRRGNLWVDFIGVATEAWNSHKQKGWIEASYTLTGRELKDLAEFWKHHKKDLEAASSAFVSAVKWAAQKESWADGKSLTLAEMLANSKLILYSQKAIQNRSDAQESASAVVGGVTVQAGETMAYKGTYNVKILSVEGAMVQVETETGAQHTAYADELGAPL